MPLWFTSFPSFCCSLSLSCPSLFCTSTWNNLGFGVERGSFSLISTRDEQRDFLKEHEPIRKAGIQHPLLGTLNQQDPTVWTASITTPGTPSGLLKCSPLSSFTPASKPQPFYKAQSSFKSLLLFGIPVLALLIPPTDSGFSTLLCYLTFFLVLTLLFPPPIVSLLKADPSTPRSSFCSPKTWHGAPEEAACATIESWPRDGEDRDFLPASSHCSGK